MALAQFVKYDQFFLDKSWQWLNDPEIKLLTQTPEFSKEGQLKWFNSLDGRTDYKVWGVTYDGIAVGVVGLKFITDHDAEYFGYLSEKEFWGKGIGQMMLDFSVTQAKIRQLSKIYLKVAATNTRAIKAYERFGFTTQDINDSGQMVMDLFLTDDRD